MRARGLLIALALVLVAFLCADCRHKPQPFVIVLTDPISTLDPIGSPTVDAASERVRVLMFNTLVRKDEKFDYVPDLASFQRAENGSFVTFTLQEGVTFHDGKPLTSADAKYTIDTLLTSNSGKAADFFEGSGQDRKPDITAAEAPDAHTLVLRLRDSSLSLYNHLISNLVTIGIIPAGSAETQKDRPVGSGPFKFLRYDSAQQVLDLEGNKKYWQGAPKITELRVRVIADANALQAELRSGRVDIAPVISNLSPDTLNGLKQDPNLQVVQFPGANVVYLGFNTTSPPLNNVRVRQAIAYAIDRESIIRDLLLGQAHLAHSILPESSWAYSAGQKYGYDPQKAMALLDEAGFRPAAKSGMRFPSDVVFSISGSSAATKQYASVIQNALTKVGIPVQIETLETNTLLERLRNGQFQMTTSRWVGGNQDPIFFKNLFATSEIPTQERAGRNRSRYSNPTLDSVLEKAANTADRTQAAALYAQAQDIISKDLPLLPLWYPANMVVAKKTVGNIKVDGSGDWGFVRNLTVGN
jgi:peptide/nickel transport system substrate-binding protein